MYGGRVVVRARAHRRTAKERYMVTTLRPAAHRPAILIVEDDRDLGGLMRLALVGAGYRASLVPRHADAVVALSASRCALVIADTAGPAVRDGGVWAALDAVRAAAGDTPVVICTAHQPRLCAGYRERGFAGLLPKPFDLEALYAVARLADAAAASAPLWEPGAQLAALDVYDD
jgi:DNA-binding NtrC family response regulator